jgi:hypothetical protein
MPLLAKARTFERGFPLFLIDPIIQYQEQGADYIYALVNGYADDKDANWDEFMPGHKIAMPTLRAMALLITRTARQDGSAICQGCCYLPGMGRRTETRRTQAPRL